MPIYKCDKCEKEFPQKSNYMYHINRKRPCVKSTEPKTYVCSFCKNTFSSQSSLKRHMKQNCSKITETKDTLEIMKNEITQLKEEIKHLKEIPKTEINNPYHNNNSNTININLPPNAFGKEQYNYISDKEFRNILSKGMQSVSAFVNRLHFDENHPENHNIYISNISSGYLLIYDGKNWNVMPNNDGITELFYKGSNILEKKYDQMSDTLDDYVKKIFSRFIDARDEETPVINGIKKDLKALLYNKRYIVETTKKQSRKAIKSS
jgi:DNA-directed RNA polymerase subunit RPC12/RpoP